MKKNIFIFLVAVLLCGAVGVVQAQTQEIFLTVEYTAQDEIKTDDFSLEGGTVQILNNSVMVIFSGGSGQNRTYEFDNINTMNFELREVQSVEKIDAETFKVYLDGSDILHISSSQSIGTVNVYSITGARVAGIESSANTAQITLSELPKGAYIVQAGTNSIKIIK